MCSPTLRGGLVSDNWSVFIINKIYEKNGIDTNATSLSDWTLPSS
jgi:hypothetical protein